eukprot:Tamp_03707.p1 GENE.Tamp_03707~~Tamp_03707.p1  ORF type:complete len:222 (+),score=31.92 Tamp_03707:68-667(+)
MQDHQGYYGYTQGQQPYGRPARSAGLGSQLKEDMRDMMSSFFASRKQRPGNGAPPPQPQMAPPPLLQAVAPPAAPMQLGLSGMGSPRPMPRSYDAPAPMPFSPVSRRALCYVASCMHAHVKVQHGPLSNNSLEFPPDISWPGQAVCLCFDDRAGQAVCLCFDDRLLAPFVPSTRSSESDLSHMEHAALSGLSALASVAS